MTFLMTEKIVDEFLNVVDRKFEVTDQVEVFLKVIDQRS